MKRIALLMLGLLALACEPIGPLPGGELSGNLASSVPSDWAFSEEFDDVQLETRPSDPYSVNLWGAGVGSSFWIASGGGGDSKWAQNIATDPRVRLRLGETLYELKAERVTDEAEMEGFLVALKRKYDFEPDPEDREKAWVFELTAR